MGSRAHIVEPLATDSRNVHYWEAGSESKVGLTSGFSNMGCSCTQAQNHQVKNPFVYISTYIILLLIDILQITLDIIYTVYNYTMCNTSHCSFLFSSIKGISGNFSKTGLILKWKKHTGKLSLSFEVTFMSFSLPYFPKTHIHIIFTLSSSLFQMPCLLLLISSLVLLGLFLRHLSSKKQLLPVCHWQITIRCICQIG